MTYTVTTTFTLNNGDNITSREEWMAFLDANIPEPSRSNFRSSFNTNVNRISLDHQYNGNEVIRTIVWTSEAANTAYKADADTIAVLDAIANIPNVTSVSVGENT